MRGGQVYGKSDRIGAYPTETPISPEDVLATMYHALGIPLDAEVQDREGRPVKVCDGRAVTALF